MDNLLCTFVLSFCFIFEISSSLDLQYEFDRFIFKFGKQYSKDSTEYLIRFQHFKKNLEIQRYLNKTQHEASAQYGATKFSDLSPEEFKALYLSDYKGTIKSDLKIKEKYTPRLDVLRKLNIPLKVDWRDYKNHSFVSPVKNQNKCGACWAFATVESVESMYAIKHGKEPPLLSVQEVIDCADRNGGCNGGTTCNALYWMNGSIPIVHEKMYPLTDQSEYCTILPNGTKGVHVRNYTCEYLAGKEEKMLWLLANHGPLTVAVDATTWSNYLGGIIQYHCMLSVNHAVQIVGYDISGGIPYYIVKNSWGSDFGIDGYLYIKVYGNLCGIAQTVSAVDVY